MNITINAFEMSTPKEASLKPLEEAAEVFGAWQIVDVCGSPEQCKSCKVEGGPHECGGLYELADEIADCIQACANLADRYGLDLQAAMKRCEERNRKRGRYGRRLVADDHSLNDPKASDKNE